MMNSLSEEIKALSRDLGFAFCGIAQAEPLLAEQLHFEQALLNGYQADMHFLERDVEKRFNPQCLLPGCKSVIVVLFHYLIDAELKADYKVAKYAYLQDYHFFMKEKLNRMGEFLSSKSERAEWRVTVDSSAISEKNWAVRAGLGHIGKNSLLQNEMGSYFVIGTLLTNLELDYDKPVAADCGDCRLCIEHCPAHAIEHPYQVNAAKCIAYRNVEDKSREENTPPFHHWIFGCDVCQMVCPKNKKIVPNMLATQYSSLFLHFQNEDFEKLQEADFQRYFAGHGALRRKFAGFKYNIEKVRNEK